MRAKDAKREEILKLRSKTQDTTVKLVTNFNNQWRDIRGIASSVMQARKTTCFKYNNIFSQLYFWSVLGSFTLITFSLQLLSLLIQNIFYFYFLSTHMCLDLFQIMIQAVGYQQMRLSTFFYFIFYFPGPPSSHRWHLH